MTKQEEEVYKAVRQMLADTESHKTTLKHAVKFLKKALKSSGLELRENCLYILGNSIKWDGENHVDAKKVLRKFSFHPPTGVKRKGW